MKISNWVNNRKIGTKIFIILILALIVISVNSGMLIRDVNNTAKELEKNLYDELYYSTFYLLNADRDFYQADQALMRTLVDESLSNEKMAELKNSFVENMEQVNERMEKAREILLLDEGIDNNQINPHFNAFSERVATWEKEANELLSGNLNQIDMNKVERLGVEFDSIRTEIDLIQENLESSALSKVEEINKKNQLSMYTSLFSVGISIIILCIFGVLLIRSIKKPVSKLVDNFEQISNADLRVEQLNINRQDEIGQLASASNKMINNLRNMVSLIQNISQSVSSHSEELTQASNEVKSGSTQVASTMQELSSGAEMQANSTSEMSSVMQIFASDVSQANEDGEFIYESSSKVLEITGEGNELMALSKKQMEKIDEIVHDAVEKVQALEVHSQEVSKLVSVIQDVAEQTNLLALNASIEAARAGEQGKGFAVVAEEVRKLAEQVSESVTDITDIVENIQTESSMVTQSLQAGYVEVEQGTKQIEITSEKFNGINASVQEMVKAIQSVSKSLAGIASTNQQMSSSIQEISAISEESAAGIEETSAISEQTSSAMEEVAQSSNDLAKEAEELNDLVRSFKL